MKATPDDCFFLTTDVVLEVHAAAIANFGGSAGLRDRALLESSVYGDVAEIAAAYLFYLCRNHPFVDGNKRAALGACLLFLRLNGCLPAKDGPSWEQLVLEVAASKLDRDMTTKRLKKLL